ncbi:flagellin [uncultured Acetatifactor sp.]|uniref:flagellin N-terminal helical domain-containing protein n=1 Tax=uncultured Acetatifactor sp. TaxID=1671927 RepID=UPI002ED467AC
MGMIVKHNLTAMNSNRMLGLTTASQAKATEKLSSGYKINRAADDAAGLAISEKMRKQIRGLTQASLNAQDGISAVQTADGALNEVHDMVQRLTELAVKAANGTLSESDRDAVQNEVDQLVAEIDRVSTTTKFNETYLLRGANGSVSGSLSYSKVAASLTSNSINFTQTSTNHIPPDPQTGTARLVFDTPIPGTTLAKTKYSGIKLTGSTATNTQISGKQITVGSTTYVLIESTSAVNSKADKASASAVVKAINDAKDPDGKGTSIKAFTSMDSMIAAIRRQYSSEIKSVTSYYDDVLGTIALKCESFADLNDAIDVSLHVGTDSSNDNKIYMNISQLSARGLGLNGLMMNGDDDDAATQAIDIIADALQKVSNQRASLGAIQNRLEHTIANLDNVVENTTSAEASIRDTDMATQMVEYSNNQILAQAGQAMLAQSNQATQGVLSLLQ